MSDRPLVQPYVAPSQGISSDPEAREDITRRREAGETLASISERYGVTRERIRQLCQKWGVSAGDRFAETDAKTRAAINSPPDR